MKKDILERDRSGEPVSTGDPDYYSIGSIIENAQRVIAKMNGAYLEKEEVQSLFTELTGREVDENFWLLPPFYTDFGRNIEIGKNVFINHCCEFMDRGGITIEDDVLIGPKVNLITINHEIDPYKRQITTCKPIIIEKRVWIGANATIMPGITVGENSIVSAGAVVTRDVESNTIVGGVPAKFIRKIEAE